MVNYNYNYVIVIVIDINLQKPFVIVIVIDLLVKGDLAHFKNKINLRNTRGHTHQNWVACINMHTFIVKILF